MMAGASLCYASGWTSLLSSQGMPPTTPHPQPFALGKLYPQFERLIASARNTSAYIELRAAETQKKHNA